MKKNVIITIKSLIKSGSDTDKLEITTKGNILIRDNSVFISYRETDKFGYEGCSVLIRIDGDKKMSINRSGDIKSHLSMQVGKRNLCSYDFPYGTAMLGVTCNCIRLNFDNKKLHDAFIEYELDINSELISKNKLFIKIKECKN